jgi:hypothetical protein
MWDEVIESVKEKFGQLRGQSWDAFVDEDADHQIRIIHLYETLTWEMVEGIGTLFLEMVQNLNYISKRNHLEDPRVYESMHVMIIDKLKESTHEDITTIPQFYLHIKSAVDSFGTYCKFIKQDISMYYHRRGYKRMDRKIRQLNLVLKELLEGFSRLNKQCDLLHHAVGDQQVKESLEDILGNPNELKDLLDQSSFSEEEKAFLTKVIEEKGQ